MVSLDYNYLGAESQPCDRPASCPVPGVSAFLERLYPSGSRQVPHLYPLLGVGRRRVLNDHQVSGDGRHLLRDGGDFGGHVIVDSGGIGLSTVLRRAVSLCVGRTRRFIGYAEGMTGTASYDVPFRSALQGEAPFEQAKPLRERPDSPFQ